MKDSNIYGQPDSEYLIGVKLLQNNILNDLLPSDTYLDCEPESKDAKGTAAKIPQYEIDALARAFLPAILEFYRSEDGQREFAEWKKIEKKKNRIDN